jgi:hypothetical protein
LGNGTATRSIDQPSSRLRALQVNIAACDVSPCLGKSGGDRATDAACGTTDKRRLAGQRHAYLSLLI